MLIVDCVVSRCFSGCSDLKAKHITAKLWVSDPKVGGIRNTEVTAAQCRSLGLELSSSVGKLGGSTVQHGLLLSAEIKLKYHQIS